MFTKRGSASAGEGALRRSIAVELRGGATRSLRVERSSGSVAAVGKHALLALTLACAACTAKTERGGTRSGDSASAAGDALAGDVALAGDSRTAGDSAGPGDASAGGDALVPGDSVCVPRAAVAPRDPRRADLVIAIDASGSMSEETADVAASINGLAASAAALGVDLHIIAIASADVCFPAPLGSGACSPDENLPAYRHVEESVGSNAALELIVSTHASWAGDLRSGATRSFLVVSDDDADMSSSAFLSAMQALDLSFADLVFSAIASSHDPDLCTSCALSCASCAYTCCDKENLCAPISAAEGRVYEELAASTGGLVRDLCLQSVEPLFDELAALISTRTRASCSYALPPDPGGGPIEPSRVAVSINPAETVTSLPNAGSLGACGGPGWFFDDPVTPERLELCPESCAVMRGDAAVEVTVSYGCQD
jgi:hypothetical protein